MNVLPILGQTATDVSTRLVNCRGCTVCCEQGGLVYLREEELPRLAALGVPVLRVDGVPFIKRLSDGRCPMLDLENRRCSIYEDRPLCCRLFPLDALNIDGRLRWGMAEICPEERRSFSHVQGGPNSDLGTGSLVRIASALNNFLNQDVFDFMRRKEAACSRVQKLEDTTTSWAVLGVVEPDDAAAVLEAGRNKTSKEEFLEKMKKKKEKKRRKEKKRKEKEKKKKEKKKKKHKSK